MDNVALIHYNRPELAFTFEQKQEELHCELLQSLQHFLPEATAALSTNSSLEAVIYSILLQFQPQHHQVKASIWSYGPTASNIDFQGLQAELQLLQ